MPLDVLSKIQGFANGGTVDASTKGAFNQLNGLAQQSSTLKQGLNGIAATVTNNGTNITPESLEKLVKLGQAFAKAMQQADLSMMGINGSFRSVDVKPLQTAEKSLDGIATKGRDIQIGIDSGKAVASISGIMKRIEKMRSDATVSVRLKADWSGVKMPKVMGASVDIQKPAQKAPKFAKGGRVTYDRRNTETAQTGGIFKSGSSTGDRNLIFANRGEGIITERALKQGARQYGMSPDRYVQALNHPSANLGRIKKGRSFALGGRTGDEQTKIDTLIASVESKMGSASGFGDARVFRHLSDIISNAKGYDAGDTKIAGAYDSLHEILKTHGTVSNAKDAEDLISLLKDLKLVVEDVKDSVEEITDMDRDTKRGLEDGRLRNNNMTIKPSTIIDAISSKIRGAGSKEEKERYSNIKRIVTRTKTSPMAASVFEGQLQKHGRYLGIGSSEELVRKMNSGGLNSDQLRTLESICNSMDKLSTEIDNAENKIETFQDAFKHWSEISDSAIRRELTNIPGIGEAFEGNVVGTMAFVAAVAYVGVQFDKLMKSVSEFVTEQAKISKSFAMASQFVNTLSGSAQNLDVFRKAMHMTREQAGALAESMNTVALAGIQSVSKVTDIARNLKDSLGEVDVSVLKDAVSLINDLPKQQVDVLINGVGAFDDKANLIANLMNDGNLEKTINLMMKGAFGTKEGSVQLSDKDKAVIDAQNKANMILEDIRQGFYTYIPKDMASSSVFYAKMIGSVGKAITTIVMLYKIYQTLKELAQRARKEERPSSGAGGESFGGGESSGAAGSSGGGEEAGTSTSAEGVSGRESRKARRMARRKGWKKGKKFSIPRGKKMPVSAPSVASAPPPVVPTGGVPSGGNKFIPGVKQIGTKLGGGFDTMVKSVKGLKGTFSSGVKSLLKGLNPAIVATAIAGLAAIVTELGFKFHGEMKRRQDKAEYNKNRQSNLNTYGNTVGWQGARLQDNGAKGSEAAADTAKALGALAVTIVGAGAALGTFTLGVGAAVGAVAGLAVGLAAFGVKMYESIKGLDNRSAFTHTEDRNWFNNYLVHMFGNNYSVEKDANADERMKNYMQALSGLDEEAKKRGEKTEQEDIIKELVALNKHVKAIELVTKGRLTAFDEQSYGTDMDLLSRFKSVGGTDNDYQKTVLRAINENARAYSMQSKVLGNQKTRILDNGALGTAARANALNKVITEETKMHKKFIDNMHNVIQVLGETPSIIVSGLVHELHKQFNDFISGGMVNNAGLVRTEAEQDVKSSRENATTLYKDYQTTKDQIKQTMKMVASGIEQNTAKLEQMKADTGIGSEEEAEAIKNRVNEKRMKSAGEAALHLADLDVIGETVQKANDLTHQGKKKLENGEADEIKEQITPLKEVLKNIQETTDDKVLKKEVGAQIANLARLEKRIADGENVTDQEIAETVGKLYAAQTHLKTLVEKAQSSKVGLTDKEKKDLDDANALTMLSKTLSSMHDTAIAQQKAYTDAGKQFIDKLKTQLDQSLNSLKAILNNGAVQFAKFMSDVLSKGEEYDTFGGAGAVLDVLGAQVDELKETRKAIDDAKQIVESDDGFKELDETLNKVFEEKEKAVEDEVGNIAERETADIAKQIYEEMLKQEKTDIHKERQGKNKIADEKLGKELIKQTEGFKNWTTNDMAKFFKGKSPFSTIEEMRMASPEEIASAFEKGLTLYGSDEEAIRKFSDISLGYIPSTPNTGGDPYEKERLINLKSGSISSALNTQKEEREQYRKEEGAKLNDLNNKKEEMEKTALESAEKKKEIARQRIAKQKLTTEKGMEYKGLMLAEARAQVKYMRNPHDANAKKEYEEAKKNKREFEESKKSGFKELIQTIDENGNVVEDPEMINVFKDIQSLMAKRMQEEAEIAKSDAEWKQKFMSVFNGMPKSLEKIVMSGQAIALSAKQGALQSKQSLTESYGNVGEAIAMGGEVRENAAATMNAKMANLNNSETVQRLEKSKNDILNEAKKQGADDKQLANMSMALDQKIVQAKYDEEKKIKDEFINSLKSSVEAAMNAIERSTQGLNIEKDLYETIGAPFEYILDIEQELVRNAKANYEQQELLLSEMEKKGIKGAELEKQKLKVAEASAAVIKASFGAQRDALDKLLGKMMGGFEQIGGIFGPDSDFMKARKAGQGYTQLPSGMISASGGTVTDYANRVMGLQGAAGMVNGVKTQRGQAEVFGGGSTIPQREEGGVLGGGWHLIHEGMDNGVGTMSGDFKKAVTEGGNPLMMNAREVLFNYETVEKKLASPLGMSAERFVAEVLHGQSPYEEIIPRAARGWTNMNLQDALGTGKGRFRKYDDSRAETAEERKIREFQMKARAATELGVNYLDNSVVDKDITDKEGNVSLIYKNGKWSKAPEEKNVVKDAKGNALATQKEKNDAVAKTTEALQNSAFGGAKSEGVAGGASGATSSADRILMAILEDTHKMVEIMGGEVDWDAFGKLADEVKGGEAKKEGSNVVVTNEADAKEVAKLEEGINKSYGQKEKSGSADMDAGKIDKVAKAKDKIVGIKLDAMFNGKKNDVGKSTVEQSLEADKESLDYVKKIYELLVSRLAVVSTTVANPKAEEQKALEKEKALDERDRRRRKEISEDWLKKHPEYQAKTEESVKEEEKKALEKAGKMTESEKRRRAEIKSYYEDMRNPETQRKIEESNKKYLEEKKKRAEKTDKERIEEAIAATNALNEETPVKEANAKAGEPYNESVKNANAPAGEVPNHPASGEGAQVASAGSMTKAVQAMSRLVASEQGASGGNAPQQAPASKDAPVVGGAGSAMDNGAGGSMKVNVSVEIQMNNDMFKARVLQIAREGLPAIMNKPRTQ